LTIDDSLSDSAIGALRQSLIVALRQWNDAMLKSTNRSMNRQSSIINHQWS